MSIQQTAIVNLALLTESLGNGQPLGNATLDGVTFLNHILKEGPSKRFNTRHKTYFCEAIKVEWAVDKIFEFRHGFMQSIRWGGPKRLTVNVDTVTAVCWDPTLNVAALAQKLLGVQNLSMIACPLDASQATKLRILRRLTFWVRYGAQCNNKIHSLDTISKETARTKTFAYTDKVTGQINQISVEQYVYQCYNLRLKYPNLPLLQSKNRYFPMEYCFLCPVGTICSCADNCRPNIILKHWHLRKRHV